MQALRFVLVAVVFVSVGAFPFLAALDVDESELETVADEEVDFINYEGPYEFVNTVAQIRAIGEHLGELEIGTRTTREYFGRYRLIHAVDPDSTDGLDADIFLIDPAARVDHIDNVRLIVSGYLERAYGYNRASAEVLARFATIYNAVHRGEREFYADRYKDVVLQYLSEEGVGISTVYREWPGNTELVIPLRDGLARVDPFTLADEDVVEELRTRRDMGIHERKDLVHLMEEVIEEEEERLRDIRERVAAKAEELDHREAMLARERVAIEDVRDEAEELDYEWRPLRLEQIAERHADLLALMVEITEEREALEEEIEDLAEREREVAEMEEEVQEFRDDIAADQEEIAEDPDRVAVIPEDEVPEEPAPEEERYVTFIRRDARSSAPRGTVVRIDAIRGVLESESDLDNVASRELRRFGPGDELMVTADDPDGDYGMIALLDGEDLSVVVRSEESVFSESHVLVEDDSLFAVVRVDESWHLGRFNDGLELEARTDRAVNPDTYLAREEGYIWAQDDEGRIGSFSIDDLAAHGE